ncbi:MAG: ATP-binding cassette domain-containing protein [Helicobacteraceae bacterium]|nr:ATP-binding cassette domain-containing protein [Helicobacteraceae bacterium]
MNIFEVKNLSLIVDEVTILDDLSFNVKQGDYVAIIGPNGGGKSTLIRVLLKLQKATSGTIKLFGEDQNRFNNYSDIGYVPQRASLIDEKFPATVLEVVQMGRIAKKSLFQRFNDDDKNACISAMKKMSVEDLSSRLIGELSGGQRQRVMIARALASNPKVLILDEPNTGVDMLSQKKFYATLKELNESENITIVFITHDIGVIADNITNLLCVNRSLLESQNPQEVIGCQTMSKLYGIDAHLIHHDHSQCGDH